MLFFITCRVCLGVYTPLNPPTPAHPPGRTIYQDKTERIGAALPSIFPVMGRTDVHWAALRACGFGKKEGPEGGVGKTVTEFSQEWLSLVGSQPWWYVTQVCPIPSRPRFTSPAPLVSPSPLPLLLPVFSSLSSALPPTPHLTPSARPSVCLLAVAASLSIIVKPHSVHFLPSLMALR